jgi:hypothetical protein
MSDQHSRPHRAVRGRRGRRWRYAIVYASISALAAGLLLAGCASVEVGPTASARPVPTVVPTVDPRLVVRGHAQPLAGRLADGARVSGTIYPALPGANTVRLRIEDPGGGAVGAAGRAEVAAAMPGMAMRPVTVTLAAHAGRYQGTIALPMFGRYTARIVVTTRRGRRHGTLTLDVPLALGT